jgi:hypothetical protein
MSDIRILSVDERDSAWEDSSPRFRVYLHANPDGTGGGTATYDVLGADALQVIDWAQREAGDRFTYAVALVADRPSLNPGDERGLVWLVGMDGNDCLDTDAEREPQDRMVARRGQPVVIPEGDRMPGGLLSGVMSWVDRPLADG